ncbi:MAG: hypothetical protein QM610_03540 [Chitinophagaceae bacterium]
MKRRFIVPALLLSLASVGANAQKYDKQKMSDLLVAKKFEEAKTELDKILANPEEASKPEIKTLKTRIYGEIVVSPELLKKYPDAADQAYGSFQEFLKDVPDTAAQMKVLKDPYIGGLNGVSNVYGYEFNQGKDGFNNKNFDEAFAGFKKAQALGTYFSENGLLAGGNRNGIDTLTTLYAGFAAQNLASTKPAYKDSAVYYYKIIVDHKITTPDAENAYKFLALQYYNNKQNDELSALLSVAKEKYPDAKDYWDQLGASLLTAGATPQQLLDKYSAASNPSETELQTYAEAFGKEKNAATDTALKAKLADAEIDAYKKLYAGNPNPLYAYNVGNLTNAKFDALEDQFRAAAGQSAALKAKRTSIEAKQQTVSDTAADWFTKSYTALKDKTDKTRQEQQVVKACTALLANIYAWKVDKARGKDAQAYDKYEALYKQYDAEYSKLSAAPAPAAK